MFFFRKSPQMPTADEALPGRSTPLDVPHRHFVLDAPLDASFGDGAEGLAGDAFEGLHRALFGLGCFWGAERAFWQHDGVVSTAVGYAAGFTPNPTYHEVCSGQTGHNEVVRVVFDPARTSFDALVRLFFESHDPTQGMRQGNDVGTQYRSGIYVYDDAQRSVATALAAAYQAALSANGFAAITTEILDAGPFYFAEDYHQQYLAKNPNGYCGLGGTGVSCPVGTGVAAE